MGGEVHGKTKLQKTMYFLGVVTGHLDSLGYRPHFYGPFSGEVAGAVGTLRSLGFVDTQVHTYGTDSRGFEMARTDYRLTEDGKEIALLKSQELSELWAQLTIGAQKLKCAGDLDYMKLSVAAKANFMHSRKGAPMSSTEMAELAESFGWRVTERELEDATRFLSSLNLPQFSG